MTDAELQVALRAAELRGVRAGLETAAIVIEAQWSLPRSTLPSAIRAIDPASVPVPTES